METPLIYYLNSVIMTTTTLEIGARICPHFQMLAVQKYSIFGQKRKLTNYISQNWINQQPFHENMHTGMGIPEQFKSTVETNKEQWTVSLNVRFFAPEGSLDTYMLI